MNYCGRHHAASLGAHHSHERPAIASPPTSRRAWTVALAALLAACALIAGAGMLASSQDATASDPLPAVEFSTAGGTPRAAYTPFYSVTVIAPPAAPARLAPQFINSAGQVAGYYWWYDEEDHAYRRCFFWENGITRDLGTGLGPECYVEDLNEDGAVLGRTTGELRGFVWQDGVLTELGTMGSADIVPAAINDRGQVVGNASPDVFLWESGVMYNLGTFGGFDASASDINNDSQIVGAFRTEADGQYVSHAFLWDDGAVLELGPDAMEGHASTINDRGLVIGRVYPIDSEPGQVTVWYNGATDDLGRAPGVGGWSSLNEANQVCYSAVGEEGYSTSFLWEDGVVTKLGTLGGFMDFGWPEPFGSNPVAINNSGHVVGYSITPDHDMHAFVWMDGVMHDLNDLVPPGSTLGLYAAYDINDSGHIAAVATTIDYSVGYVLTPVSPWTVMVYLDGDNELDHYTFRIFNQLERAAANPNIRLVALWDRLGASAQSYYYHVQPDSDLGQLATYTDGINRWPIDEPEMGNPATLEDFAVWARTHYPAPHEALVFFDHGHGLGGAMTDWSPDRDHLTLPELKAALLGATESGTNKIDLLYMDACLMAMIEDAFQFRDSVNHYVASENVKFALDGAYHAFLSGIDSSTTPSELANSIVAGNARAHAARNFPYTFSSADLSHLPTVVSATNSLAGIMSSQLPTSAMTLTMVAAAVQRFETNGDGLIDPADDYIDLYHFGELVDSSLSDSALRSAAQSLMTAVDSYAASENGSGSWDGITWILTDSHGASVFFPSTASSFYNADNYDFAVGATWPYSGTHRLAGDGPADTWGAFLVNYFQAIQPGGPDNPTPPEPIAMYPAFELYIPVVIK